jgi:eukaryotic-like serine/threonine-protein kinase
VLASINHTHIAAIHGLEESGERKFLVMELVEGETLAQRISRGPIPVDEALQIAAQMAEALEAAHEKGIIHRDLKPANVKITPDGKVKVLDFGLAKAFEKEPSNAQLSQSPTLSIAATNAGLILGTAAYMSPEQARGRPVDRRTDIFAFGCVLYEMLTGRAAFEGEDVAEILGAVLKTEADWTQLPADVPPSVRKLLRLCLEKNPRNRRSDAADVRIDIEQAVKEPQKTVVSSAAATRSVRVPWIAAAVMTIAFVTIALVHFRTASPEAAEMRLDITTPATSAPLDFALSPDGSSLVFVASGDGPQRLWLRQLDKAEAQPLAGTEDATFPFWSPDNRSIGFFANGKLKRMDIGGGRPQVLANATNARGGAWNSEGTILFAPLTGGQLFRISASGGEAAPATHLGPNDLNHRFPDFLPDGRHFLFYIDSNREGRGVIWDPSMEWSRNG